MENFKLQPTKSPGGRMNIFRATAASAAIMLAVMLSASPLHAGVLDIVIKQAPIIIGEQATDYAISSDSDTAEQRAINEGISSGAGAVASIGVGVGGAAAAGAGSLAGYAGIASAVSSLGLGSVTAAIATAIHGAPLAGAAATAVCTAAVGGPLVMGGIIVGGSAALGYGVYKSGEYLTDKIAGFFK